jgi:ribosomal protein L36
VCIYMGVLRVINKDPSQITHHQTYMSVCAYVCVCMYVYVYVGVLRVINKDPSRSTHHRMYMHVYVCLCVCGRASGDQ